MKFRVFLYKDISDTIRLEQEAVREQLARLLDNRRFRSAEKLKAFLAYSVEKTLAGERDHIKEYNVAIEVYGRRPDYDPKTDSSVRVEAARLRSRLRDYYDTDGARDPVIIELPKGCYVAGFRPNPESPPVPPDPTPARRNWRPYFFTAVVTAALVLAAVSAGRLFVGAPAATIAILPFLELSPSPENTSQTRELTAGVQSALGRSGKLKVLGAGAALALEANVRRGDGRVMVRTVVIDRQDGSTLWSGAFDGDPADGPEILARRVSELVERQTLEALRQQARRDSPRAKALEYYRAARGRPHHTDDGFLLRQEGSAGLPLEKVNWAVGLLEQSVAADPGFAEGHTALASYYQVAGEYDRRMLDKAEAAARRAIDLNPDLAEPYAILGYIDYLFRWRFRQSAAEFTAALDREPRLLSSYRLLGDCLALLGRFEDALAVLERARAVYPNHSVIETTYAMALFHAGRYRQMERHARQAAARFPQVHLTHWALGLALEQEGRLPESIEQFQRCLDLSPDDGRCVPAIGHAYALAGRRREAEAVLAKLGGRGPGQSRARYSIALVLTGLNEREAAVHNLETAFGFGEMSFPYLKVDPRFKPVRQTPKVQAMLAKLGL